MFCVIKFVCQEPRQFFGDQNADGPVCTPNVSQKICVFFCEVCKLLRLSNPHRLQELSLFGDGKHGQQNGLLRCLQSINHTYRSYCETLKFVV
jgi:hypothetical protein